MKNKNQNDLDDMYQSVDRMSVMKENIDMIITTLEQLNRKLLNESKNNILDPNEVMEVESKFQQILKEYNNLKMESFLKLYELIYDINKEYVENGRICGNRLEGILKDIKKYTYLSGYKLIFPDANDCFDEETMESSVNDYDGGTQYVVSNTLHAGYSYTNHRKQEMVKRPALVKIKEKCYGIDVDQSINEKVEETIMEKSHNQDEIEITDINIKEKKMNDESCSSSEKLSHSICDENHSISITVEFCDEIEGVARTVIIKRICKLKKSCEIVELTFKASKGCTNKTVTIKQKMSIYEKVRKKWMKMFH